MERFNAYTWVGTSEDVVGLVAAVAAAGTLMLVIFALSSPIETKLL